ncbi:MAG: NADH-quinone oxidoreductase subunit J [Anaerolineaceae bacterium]
MVYVLVAAGILACAVLAIGSKKLLVSAIWLAATSALVAVMIFMLGAVQVAVIELSVGAGLVTVLFVFAINISGEEAMNLKPVMPKPLAWGLVLIAAGLTIFLTIRGGGLALALLPSTQSPAILWSERYLDILLQIALIFSGVLGVLGLLSEGKPVIQKEDQA